MGWPLCAKEGCGAPSILKFEFTDANGPIWVDLCGTCVFEVDKMLGEVSDLKEERNCILFNEMERTHGEEKETAPGAQGESAVHGGSEVPDGSRQAQEDAETRSYGG